MPPAVLRPLSLGELLDETFSLYRRHFLLFMGIVALPELIPLVLGTGVTLLGPLNRDPLTATVLNGLFRLVIGLAYFLANAASLAATVVAVSHVYLGRPATIAGSYALVRGKVLRTFWLFFVISVSVGVGLLLLLVPGVLAAIWYSVAIPIAIIEDRRTGEALNRSVDLTKGRRWNILVVFILFVALSFAAGILFGLPSALLPATWRSISTVTVSVGNFVASTLAGPFLTIALSLVYYDLRVRKEGFDLELMLSSLPPAAPASR